MKQFSATTAVFFVFWLVIAAAYAAEEEISFQEEPGTISGQLVYAGGAPFTPGFVAFFGSDNLAPMDYGQTRRSPKMIAFLDENGRFTTELMAPGSYYVGAMERKKWRGGPPLQGEKRYSAFDQKGEYLIVTLLNGGKLDIGRVVVREPEATPDLKDYFTIEGRLLDKDGQGVPDAVVVVKRDYDTPKAEFISGKSAFNGYYQLKLPPGKYFLIARQTVEGSMRPKPDSIYGELGQFEPIGIGGKSDKPVNYLVGVSGQEYKDVDIAMFRVPIPDVKRQETEALVKADKYSRADLADNLPLRKKAAGGEVEELKIKSEKLKVDGEKLKVDSEK